jgi:D-glycero-alpha-D-manno-heptose-7-phosphate kinase
MIITRTPFRISFAGGGSDLESFYIKHEGCVVSTAINKYMHILIHPSFQQRETTVKYTKTEHVDDVRQISHPIVRQMLLDYKLSGVEITSIADVPSGTGLGSSSSFAVGLAHAISAYVGKYRSAHWLAECACETEIEKLGEPIGKQDQYAAAYGGLNCLRFYNNGSVKVEKVMLQPHKLQELQENLLMFYTGDQRSASDVLREQNHNLQHDEQKQQNLVQMVHLAEQLKESLNRGSIDDIGLCLHENWMLKKELASSISSNYIDELYQTGIANGALGGKLLGAGGGGFLLFYCHKDKQKRLRSSLSQLQELEFAFDEFGSTIIYVGDKEWD